MNFLATGFAPALLLLTVPVILYIIFRRKKKDVSWGAIYILKLTLQSKSKVNVWKQYFIIFLRTLAFLALPLIFMKPFSPWSISEDGSFPKAQPATHRVAIIDVSRSMLANRGAGTAFDESSSLCLKLIDASHTPGRVDIIPLDPRLPESHFTNFPISNAERSKLLATLQTSEGRPDFEKSLKRAIHLFKASHYQHKELYLLSDFSRQDFPKAQAVSEMLKALKGMQVKSFAMTYENPKSNNTAILDMNPGVDVLYAKHPTIFYLKVAYYGSKASAETWLSIEDQKKNVLYESVLNLAPGEKTLQIPLELKTGEQILTAKLKDDDYDVDNQLSKRYLVKGGVQILVVQDINLSKGFDNPRTWLDLALKGGEKASSKVNYSEVQGMSSREQRQMLETAKNAQAKLGHFSTRIDYAIPSQLSADYIKGRDMIILLDTAGINPDFLEDLRRYIVRGGSVLLAPGSKVPADKFNEVYASISPARLDKVAKNKLNPKVYQNANYENAEIPFFKEMDSLEGGRFSDPRFYNHYRILDDSIHKSANTIYRLSEGDPLLVERDFGRGKVYLWTAGLGMSWSSIVVHPAFPLFLTKLANVSSAKRHFPLNPSEGQVILQAVDAPKVKVEEPDGKVETLDSSLVGANHYIRIDDVRRGTYRIFADIESEEPTHVFHIAGERVESDYRPISQETKSLLGTELHGEFNTDQTMLFQSVGATYPGHSRETHLAFILVALILLEGFLVWRWFA